jgi:hypothetical protein
MPALTLGQAAKATGKQKSTILDAIRAGRLSAGMDDKNQWQIEPCELFRVYPAQQAIEREATPTQQQETAAQLAQMLERERTQLLAQIEDLKTDRDHWRNQATMLLTHQPEQKPEPEQPKSRLWQKLFGRT